MCHLNASSVIVQMDNILLKLPLEISDKMEFEINKQTFIFLKNQKYIFEKKAIPSLFVLNRSINSKFNLIFEILAKKHS